MCVSQYEDNYSVNFLETLEKVTLSGLCLRSMLSSHLKSVRQNRVGFVALAIPTLNSTRKRGKLTSISPLFIHIVFLLVFLSNLCTFIATSGNAHVQRKLTVTRIAGYGACSTECSELSLKKVFFINCHFSAWYDKKSEQKTGT